jgi:hypothetical protein
MRRKSKRPTALYHLMALEFAVTMRVNDQTGIDFFFRQTNV